MVQQRAGQAVRLQVGPVAAQSASSCRAFLLFYILAATLSFIWKDCKLLIGFLGRGTISLTWAEVQQESAVPDSLQD